MSAELLQVLLETALAASVATLLVLALRRPVRRVLGARAAYALWWLVPVALLAVLLPSPRVESTLRIAPLPAAATVLAAAPAPATRAPWDATPWIALAWALGSATAVARLLQRQRRFRRALGPLHEQPDGSLRAETAHAGPAVIGALRGRVVLPADFDERYTPLQRELVLRHERVHIARFDLSANLVASALRCLHWFNPLLHHAFARFRLDQELAADALVLAQRPDARRAYADAMLGTSLLSDPPPLGCHWQSAHPLKERIMMLRHPLPGALRTTTGALLAMALALGTGYAAWAAQPARETGTSAVLPADGDPALQITLRKDAAVWLQQVTYLDTVDHDTVATGDGTLALDYRVTERSAERIAIEATVRRAGAIVSQPSLAFARGDDASIALDTHGFSFTFRYDSVANLRAGATGPAQDVTYNRISPPRYPAAAIKDRAQGTAVLRVHVDAQGLPGAIAVESSAGDARLDDAAIATVRNWRFNPAQDAGAPVAHEVLVPITFSLDEHAPAAATPAGALDEIYVRAPKG